MAVVAPLFSIQWAKTVGHEHVSLSLSLRCEGWPVEEGFFGWAYGVSGKKSARAAGSLPPPCSGPAL